MAFSIPAFLRARQPLLFIATLIALALVTLLSPVERTLGETARIVYFHGAWVLTGKIVFGIASLVGLAALVLRREPWHAWSRALGRTGMVFWVTYLPMSLWVQTITWGGINWDEPRWRIPLAFGIAGVLLQVALWVMDTPLLTDLANLLFGAALWWELGTVQNVLHPDDPISSAAQNIQVSFLFLMVLSLFAAAQIGVWWMGRKR